MDSGKDKVKKICELLRKETLEPAKTEAEEILVKANSEAKAIKEMALREGREMIEQAKAEIQKEKEIFHTALNQASRQTMEFLKQRIEEKLFQVNLKEVLEKKTQDPQVLSDLIRVIIQAIEKEGIQADLSSFIPAAVPADKVNSLLGAEILKKLREKSVLLTSIGGGVEVKLKNESVTIDLSAETLKEIVAQYVRKDFRELIFG